MTYDPVKAKAYRDRYKAKTAEYNKKYYAENVEYFRRQCEEKRNERNANERRWRTDPINKKKLSSGWKRYRENNFAKVLTRMQNRRARKKQAMPKWFDEFDQLVLEEMNDKARELKRLTGVEHHVDHIVPLSGGNVCGLHWHKNWQILSEPENCKKSNKH